MKKEKDKTEKLLDMIELIQKEIFNFDKIEMNLILLYQYPTSKVNLFYSRIERLFGVTLEHRPDTVNNLIGIIIEQTKESWWK